MSIASPTSSGFYTWPESITKDVRDTCQPKPPPGGGICLGNYYCTVVDGYRNDLSEEADPSFCEDNFPECEPGPVEAGNCDALKKGPFIKNIRTMGGVEELPILQKN